MYANYSEITPWVHWNTISSPETGVFILATLARVNASHWFNIIAGFHTRDQLACISIATKEKVCIRIELNFPRICQGHNLGRHFFV